MNKIKCIYAIKDKRNDKVIYIGQTVYFNRRKSNHFTTQYAPIDKYMFDEGRDKFEMYILEELDENISKEEMKMKEQEYIEQYNTIEYGLNKNISGDKEFQKQYRIEYQKEFNRTEKRAEYIREYNNSEKRAEFMREYRKTEKCREYHREYQRQYRLKKKLESQDKQ